MKPYTAADVEGDLDAAVARQQWREVEVLADRLDQLTSKPPPPLGAAALWYAEHGLPVFPVMPNVKIPYPGTRGVSDATTDTAQVVQWWTAMPQANIGVATGHRIDVVDFDGPGAHAAWGRTYSDTWAGLRVLATSSTPRPGGLHLWVPAQPGRGNRAALMDGVDYRGLGGYVLAPPSVLDDRPKQHPGSYRFLRKLHPEHLS